MRILVVEDEPSVALVVGRFLTELGCVVVGPASTLQQALNMVRSNEIDGAVLDTDLHGENSSPAASELTRRSLPFIVLSGYAPADADPPAFRNVPRMSKPFEVQDFTSRMLEVFSSVASR